MHEKIERYALRDLVHRKLLEQILRGHLPPGRRVKDTDLSEALHVSRTPVRETLLRLVKEGFLENAVGKGFVVRPLTGEEVQELYPIIGALETLALKSSVHINKGIEKELVADIAAMGKPKTDYISLIELDQQWHGLLLSGCKNQRLMAMISELKRLAFRYEYAFMQDVELVKTSMEEHRGIAAALFEQGVEAASTLLAKHWEFSKQALVMKLEKQTSENE